MSLGILGERITGKEVRSRNVLAVQAIANVLRSSLGPKGLDKMLVDDVGDVTISNDGATILKQLEVQHPAAKMLVDLSDLQDQEVGDGTTSVVLLAVELLRRANDLANMGIHATSIIAGYKMAIRECVKYIKEHLSKRMSDLGEDVVVNIARTTLSSKMLRVNLDYFSEMVVKAIKAVETADEAGNRRFPVDAINILKTHGKSTRDSYLVNGYALMMGRAAQGMPIDISGAKIAFLDFAIKHYRLHFGVQVQITDPVELEQIRLKEKNVTKERIAKILASGANVVLTSQGIDDMSLKYFLEAGVMAYRRVPKKDLRRIARLTGGKVVLTMSTFEGDEAFPEDSLGRCDKVYEERVGDVDFSFFEGCSTSRAATIILRGANDFMVDEAERSVHDALCATSRALEQDSLVPGGGCVETALSLHLERFARTLGSREQMAMAEFAESLLVIPKTLALNAALDATELVAKLRAFHAKAQAEGPISPEDADYRWYGISLADGELRNNLSAGVLEATVSKIKSIKFATEAAVTILRIDDLVTLEPEKEPVDD
ncbi:t-complex protein 1, alpha subunit, putative [Babesia bigemina]|uniref:T-complex protein 1 subunit alpha n=1 Tax=Babesia bigemina TaxID=5866 RepID=A0A061D4D7_BABBI|nr:t-complex protein 1, alpha subunit, putative [Babesia bigemina]CDR95601.1 t-complex protein 1, alpha subunit, putative [Babesia bigemina]|eukprot:XP_012767787.1 t-complex protein 1, alpha subunit, putative [Babesia bigemina]